MIQSRTASDTALAGDITRVLARKSAWAANVGAFLEGLFCFFALSVFMGAYLSIPLKLSGEALKSGEADPLTGACRTAILAGLVLLCALRWRRVGFVILQSKALLLFLSLATVSAAWSAAPDMTLRRVVALSTTVMFAWYACASIPLERMIRLLAASILTSAVISAAIAIGVPQAGVMTEGDLAGAWNGVYMHKNQLGGMMLLGCLAYGWLRVQTPHRRFRYLLCGLFCFAVAVMSRSRSAQVMIVLLPLIACVVSLAKLRGVTRLWVVYLLIIGSAVGGVLGTLFFADVMVALGKDPSLTGRVPLWSFLISEIGKQPVLGYGYGAYFLDWSARLQWINTLTSWNVPEAHNGYIEMLLQLGIPGVILAAWLLLSTACLALSKPLRDELPWASFATVYAIAFLLLNLVELLLMNPGDIHSMILPMLYVGLHTELARRRIVVQEARSFAAQIS